MALKKEDPLAALLDGHSERLAALGDGNGRLPQDWLDEFSQLGSQYRRRSTGVPRKGTRSPRATSPASLNSSRETTPELKLSRSAAEYMSNCSFTPVITERTERLMRSKRARGSPNSSHEREKTEADKQLTFRPKLNPKSLAMVDANEEAYMHGAIRLERMYRTSSKWESAKEALREKMKREEIKKCSFAPVITKAGHAESRKTFQERADLWERGRAEKHAAALRRKEKEGTEHSYKPVINSPGGTSAPASPRPSTAPAGVDKFYDRIKKAKDVRVAKEEKLNYHGPEAYRHRGEGQITTQPFSFDPASPEFEEPPHQRRGHFRRT